MAIYIKYCQLVFHMFLNIGTEQMVLTVLRGHASAARRVDGSKAGILFSKEEIRKWQRIES